MTLQEFYVSVGGDYTEVYDRIPDGEMLRKFVLRFAEDETYDLWRHAVEQEDVSEAFRAVLTMKEIVMNLGFGRLNMILSDLTERLRAGTEMPEKSRMEAFEREYRNVIDGIERLQKD